MKYLMDIRINFDTDKKRDRFVGYGINPEDDTVITRVYGSTPEKVQEKILKNLEEDSKIRDKLNRYSGGVEI